jgi:hypothetical protein
VCACIVYKRIEYEKGSHMSDPCTLTTLDPLCMSMCVYVTYISLFSIVLEDWCSIVLVVLYFPKNHTRVWKEVSLLLEQLHSMYIVPFIF